MALFGKKKQGSANDLNAPQSGGSLSSQVSSLRNSGASDDQIVQNLQDKGYKSDEIYNAMSQADIGQPAGPQKADNPNMMPPPNMPPPQQPQQQNGPPPPGQSMPPPMDMPPPQSQSSSLSASEKERIEEVAEAIIDEKWKELMGDINKVVEWKRVVDSRLDKMDQQLSDLKSNFDTLHKGVLGRISEYDKNLSNVGVEIKAMEKVFQKILPTFTENVNKLSRMVKK